MKKVDVLVSVSIYLVYLFQFHILKVAQLWQHLILILQYLMDDHYLTYEKAKTMRKDVILSAQKLGFDKKLYLPTSDEQKYSTFGQYIKFAEELKNRGLVSDGKYEELLIDAYRSDIVYGSDEEGQERYD
jgi:hypothetical protein